MILTADIDNCRAKELVKYNIKYDATNLFKLFKGREIAISSGMKINEVRYEVYQYE